MNKINQFLQSIILFFFRSSIKRRHLNAPFNICDKMQAARKILICFPHDPAETDFAVSVVKELQNAFPAWAVTICAADELKVAALKSMAIVRRTEKDATSFGLPKKAFVQNLFRSGFDIVLDLSLNYDFTNLALVFKSEIDVRIGFYHQIREDFYNFMLRQKEGASHAQAREMLVNTLKAL